jgi:hypothetical protein
MYLVMRHNHCNSLTNSWIDTEIEIRRVWIYSRKTDPKTKRRRNLGTFNSLEAAKKHEKEIQYFKRH